MSDLSHLSSEAGAETLLPNSERILRIRAERWINYRRAEAALARMAELLEYPQPDRMPCLLLFGAIGMGKTKILRKFLRDHPPVFDNYIGVTKSGVVSMQMPPDPDEKAFYEELLVTLQAPVRSSMTANSLRRVARELLRFVGARMLIIDEVHALLAGSYRQHPAGIGLFDHSRYFRMSGNHFPGTSFAIEERQAEIDKLYAELFSECPIHFWTPGAQDYSDEQILERARRSEKFRKLYDEGDLTAHGNDWSAADLALVNLLCLYTSGNVPQMDRLFRGSSLMREKWDAPRSHSTYGCKTIARALQGRATLPSRAHANRTQR